MSVSTLRRFLQYGAVKLSSRSEGAWISSSFTPGRRTARMSSASSARQRVRRLSAWLARRFGSFVPRNLERSTSSSTPRHRAQALVSVKVHRQRCSARSNAGQGPVRADNGLGKALPLAVLGNNSPQRPYMLVVEEK